MLGIIGIGVLIVTGVVTMLCLYGCLWIAAEADERAEREYRVMVGEDEENAGE